MEHTSPHPSTAQCLDVNSAVPGQPSSTCHVAKAPNSAQTPRTLKEKQTNTLTVIFKGALLISFPPTGDGFPRPLWADTSIPQTEQDEPGSQGSSDRQVSHPGLNSDSLPSWVWMHLRRLPHFHSAHSLAKQAPPQSVIVTAAAQARGTQPASNTAPRALTFGVVRPVEPGDPGRGQLPQTPQGPSAGSGREGQGTGRLSGRSQRSAPCAGT